LANIVAVEEIAEPAFDNRLDAVDIMTFSLNQIEVVEANQALFVVLTMSTAQRTRLAAKAIQVGASVTRLELPNRYLRVTTVVQAKFEAVGTFVTN
jgi:hypothetical protein